MLLGPNGCGKSTLLKLAAGVRCLIGRIFVAGCDIWKEEVKARTGLVYLPEQPDLTPYATIREILDLVCRLRGEPRASGERALQILAFKTRRTARSESFRWDKEGGPSLPPAWSEAPLIFSSTNLWKEWISTSREKYSPGLRTTPWNGATLLVVSHFLEPFVPLATQAVTIKDGMAVHIKELPSAAERKQALLEELAKGKT